MRADRLLSIMLLLQVNRRVTARELAKRLEVSERTVLRDMDALSAAGVPVVAERGAGGGWSLLEAYQTKLTGLNAAEIQSLFLARPPRLMADLGLGHESDAAMIKLQASLPAGSRQHADFARQRILVDARGWRDPAESVSLPAHPPRRAVARPPDSLHLQPCARRSSRAHRRPLGASREGQHLVSHRPRGSRAAYLSRLAHPGSGNPPSPATRPPGFDLGAYWEHSAAEFREKLPRYYATFRASQGVMKWVRYRGWRFEEETVEGDALRLRMRFDSEEEAIQFALSFGSQIEALDPPALRTEVVTAAQATIARYA